MWGIVLWSGCYGDYYAIFKFALYVDWSVWIWVNGLWHLWLKFHYLWMVDLQRMSALQHYCCHLSCVLLDWITLVENILSNWYEAIIKYLRHIQTLGQQLHRLHRLTPLFRHIWSSPSIVFLVCEPRKGIARWCDNSFETQFNDGVEW